jgi:signal-transduction protein with cAMP-binding, CBS, and nucleotidyltransferase domain
VTKGDEQSLAGIELLAELTEAERQSLEKACAWRSYPAHEQIIDRHSDSRDIFFVVSGRVRVVNYSLSGREISFDDIETGGYFGELAAIDGQPRSVHAEILRLARENEKDDNTAVIRPIPIHSDIASRVSTTRETVARVLGDL